MSETNTKDVLEQLKAFDFCHRCDAVKDGGGFLQDAVIAEIEQLRARVAELETNPMYSRVLLLVQVECDREQVPGWGHDPQEMADGAALRVMQMLQLYKPRLCLATAKVVA